MQRAGRTRPMSKTATAPRACAQRIFDPSMWRQDQPLRVVLIGTDFEVRVWETLLRIPMGRATTYSGIASNIGSRRRRARSARRSEEPDLVRGALPPRGGQERRAHRLSLGHDAQAGDARLGSRAGRACIESRS